MVYITKHTATVNNSSGIVLYKNRLYCNSRVVIYDCCGLVRLHTVVHRPYVITKLRTPIGYYKSHHLQHPARLNHYFSNFMLPMLIFAYDIGLMGSKGAMQAVVHKNHFWAPGLVP